jgi:hypothetical protein
VKGRFSIKAERSSLKGRHFMCQEPLEDVMASVDFPIYGLTEEVFGLRSSGYWSCPKDQLCITLNYQSDLYMPFLHEKSGKEPTFSVCNGGSLNGQPLPDINPTSYVRWEEGPDLPVQEGGRTFAFCSCLTIDGEQFMGNFLYFPAPIFHSIYMFTKGHLCLQGQARGPHPDELIQILESLHVLNGKAVE